MQSAFGVSNPHNTVLVSRDSAIHIQDIKPVVYTPNLMGKMCEVKEGEGEAKRTQGGNGVEHLGCKDTRGGGGR